MSMTLPTVVVFVFGTVLGSFLNVVIYRLPRGRSIVRPGSRCPHCETPIRPVDNIPILSFVMLRGRCRACRAPIGWRYVVVEVAAGLLLAGLWLHFAPVRAWVSLVSGAVFVLLLLAVFFIDLDYQIVPDAITYPGVVAGVLFAIPQGQFKSSALAAAGAGAAFLLIAMISGVKQLVDLVKHAVRHRLRGRLRRSRTSGGEAGSVPEPDHPEHQMERLLVHLMVHERAVRDVVRRALSPDDFLDTRHRGLVQALLDAPDESAETLRGRIEDEEQQRLLTELMLEEPTVPEGEREQVARDAINYIRGGMGGGDIKLAAMMGAFLGWPAIAVALLLAATSGAAVGLLLIASKRRSRKDAIPFGLKDAIPFGPFLALGGIVALFAADAIIRWYMGWYLGIP